MVSNSFDKVYPVRVIESGIGLVDTDAHILLGIAHEGGLKVVLAFTDAEGTKAIRALNKMQARLKNYGPDNYRGSRN